MSRQGTALVLLLGAVAATALLLRERSGDPVPASPQAVPVRDADGVVVEVDRARGEAKTGEAVRDVAAASESAMANPHWRVFGVVRSDETRMPGALVEVVLRTGSGPPALRFTTTSGAHGRYECRLDGLDREPRWREGYAALEARASAPRHAPGLWRLVPMAKPSGSSAELDLSLRPGATLRGRVLDEAKRPVAGAKVSLYEEGSWRYIASDETNGNGEYLLGARRPGHHRAGARHAAHGVAVSGPCWLDSSHDQRCPDLTLRPSASITGVAVTSKGAPLPGVRVDARLIGGTKPATVDLRAFPMLRISDDAATTPTDAEGRFRFSTLVPGRYRLTVSAHATELRPGVELEVITGPQPVTLVADVAVVDVRALDAPGQPAGLPPGFAWCWHPPETARQAHATFREGGFAALKQRADTRLTGSATAGSHVFRPGFLAVRLELAGLPPIERGLLALEPGTYVLELALPPR